MAAGVHLLAALRQGDGQRKHSPTRRTFDRHGVRAIGIRNQSTANSFSRNSGRRFLPVALVSSAWAQAT